MNTAISLFKFCTLIFILYILVIFLICRAKKCNAKAAMRIFWDFVLDCFNINTGSTSVMDDFPVRIGFDYMGFPQADLIENAFGELAKDFGAFHFCDVVDVENCLLYQFKAELPKKAMSDFELIQYTQKKCEMIVHRYMHSMNPLLGHISSLVATNYIDGILFVSIARNMNGTKENYDYSRSVREYQAPKNYVASRPLEEEWDDNDDEMGI